MSSNANGERTATDCGGDFSQRGQAALATAMGALLVLLAISCAICRPPAVSFRRGERRRRALGAVGAHRTVGVFSSGFESGLEGLRAVGLKTA